MDECSEYLIESENGEYIANILTQEASISLDVYVDRFVDITVGEEYWCVECGAYPVYEIEFAYDCEMPVQCFVDPCAVVDCADGYDCYSDYCGGCYGDCVYIEQDCIDFTGIDFGMCDMFLGYGWMGDACQGISGCGWDNNGVDYSNYFFSSIGECENECSGDFVSCDEDEVEINNLCFNSLDISYLQGMIDNSYESGVGDDCEDNDPYCGSPNPYMDAEDGWFWNIIDGESYIFSNANGIVEPLELGLQDWVDGRLISIMCGAYIYCQLSGDIPEVQTDQLSEIEVFRFEYNYLSGYIPASICDLQLNDNDYLEFDLTGNLLCPPYPECIENAVGYQNTTDCFDVVIGDINDDGQINVIDVVLLISFILQENTPSQIEFLASDSNQDSLLNVLDVVALVAIIIGGEVDNDILPEECYLEPDTGPCFGFMPMYYFDTSTNSCQEFIWGGCQGLVPFQSLSECQFICEE